MQNDAGVSPLRGGRSVLVGLCFAPVTRTRQAGHSAQHDSLDGSLYREMAMILRASAIATAVLKAR
jgi:hypothetical protein